MDMLSMHNATRLKIKEHYIALKKNRVVINGKSTDHVRNGIISFEKAGFMLRYRLAQVYKMKFVNRQVLLLLEKNKNMVQLFHFFSTCTEQHELEQLKFGIIFDTGSLCQTALLLTLILRIRRLSIYLFIEDPDDILRSFYTFTASQMVSFGGQSWNVDGTFLERLDLHVIRNSVASDQLVYALASLTHLKHLRLKIDSLKFLMGLRLDILLESLLQLEQFHLVDYSERSSRAWWLKSNRYLLYTLWHARFTTYLTCPTRYKPVHLTHFSLLAWIPFSAACHIVQCFPQLTYTTLACVFESNDERACVEQLYTLTDSLTFFRITFTITNSIDPGILSHFNHKNATLEFLSTHPDSASQTRALNQSVYKMRLFKQRWPTNLSCEYEPL